MCLACSASEARPAMGDVLGEENSVLREVTCAKLVTVA